MCRKMPAVQPSATTTVSPVSKDAHEGMKRVTCSAKKLGTGDRARKAPAREPTWDRPASPLRSISWKLAARPCGASSSCASHAGSLLSAAPPVSDDVGSAPLLKLRGHRKHVEMRPSGKHGPIGLLCMHCGDLRQVGTVRRGKHCVATATLQEELRSSEKWGALLHHRLTDVSVLEVGLCDMTRGARVTGQH